MRKVIGLFTVIILGFLLGGCGQNDSTDIADLMGSWQNDDGVQIYTYFEDGTGEVWSNRSNQVVSELQWESVGEGQIQILYRIIVGTPDLLEQTLDFRVRENTLTITDQSNFEINFTRVDRPD